MTYFRFQVKAAVTWRIVTELLRRHGRRYGLRVLETHPGGGQYDCLSLFAGASARAGVYASPSDKIREICSFNQVSQHLHVLDGVRSPRHKLEELEWPDGNDYVQAFLEAADTRQVIDEIETALGFASPGASQLPPSTPAVLTFRVIDELLAMKTLDADGVDARMGYIDTSGYGSGLHPDLNRFAAFAAGRPALVMDQLTPADMDYAADHWLLYRSSAGDKRRLIGLFRLDGTAYAASEPDMPISLIETYNRLGRRIAPTAAELRSRLGW